MFRIISRETLTNFEQPQRRVLRTPTHACLGSVRDAFLPPRPEMQLGHWTGLFSFELFRFFFRYAVVLQERQQQHGARHTACTVEMADVDLPVECAVVDEGQVPDL